MIAARIKRLVLLIVVLTPLVFGGLAIHAYSQMKGFQQLVHEHTSNRLDKVIACERMTSEERRLNYSCSESAMYMNDDSSKMLGDGIIYWREHLELYQDIAIYVPLATLALYFAVKWIWFGKVANEQPDQLQQTLWQYRKSILWGVAILLGLGVLYVLRPERTIEILMKGAVQGGIVGGVVALVMWYRRRRK